MAKLTLWTRCEEKLSLPSKSIRAIQLQSTNRDYYYSPDGKKYILKSDSKTTLIVRPRGWHLNERFLRKCCRSDSRASMHKLRLNLIIIIRI